MNEQEQGAWKDIGCTIVLMGALLLLWLGSYIFEV